MEEYQNIDKEIILEELYSTGKPQSIIAQEFGVSESTIERWIKEKYLENNLQRRKYFKIIHKIGMAFFIPGLIFFYFDKLILAFVILFVAGLLQIPESYYTEIKECGDERYLKLRVVRFIKLILITIICVLGIIIICTRCTIT